MKSTIKKILAITIIILGIALYPISTSALNEAPIYYDISTKTKATTKEIDITDLELNNNVETSSLSYGLVGTLKNKTNETKKVTIIVFYYDETYDMISQGSLEKTIYPYSEVSYVHMLNTSTITPGYTVNDIKFYSIMVATTNANNTIPVTTPSALEEYSNYPYVIDSYNVKIKVNENNSFDITETITAYFNQERHGIYRRIPLKNEIKRLDGTESNNFAKISKVKVDNEYTTSSELSNYEIKIGSADKTITGKKQYKISYHYSIGKDSSNEYDELYFNIIGNEWDTVIGDVTFEISMPKEFDSSKLGFSSGKIGSLNSDSVAFDVEGTKITGKLNKVLEKGEGLTVRLELEEGYFKISPLIKGLDYLIFFIPIVCFVISLSIWNKYGKDDKVVEVINCYPPEELNSVDLAFKYKGRVEDNDVVSLLIYLANKGYIKIEEETFNNFSYGDFSVKKIKAYDGDNKYEKLFLEGMFKCKKKPKKAIKKLSEREKELNELEDVVTSNDLKYKFSPTIYKISRGINAKKNKSKIFMSGTNKKNGLIIVLMLLTYFLAIGIPTYIYSSLEETIITLFIAAMYIPFFVFTITDQIPLSFRVPLLICLIAFLVGISFVLPISVAVTSNILYLFSLLVSMICLGGMAICLMNMPKRTKYGNKILGEIKGFKTYLETAEQEKIKALVEENPNYFYDILPYTYVLGISRKWINKFESITLAEPSWYKGISPFNTTTFGKSINRTMSSARTTYSSGSSSSGSSSSGGGISGGGSGGGGGGSW